MQEILEPENISGVKIIQENDKLILENSRLSLKNIIENYKYITDNCIDLSSFVNEYKNSESRQQEENGDEIILSFVKTDANLMSGDIVKVRIDGAMEYDLIGSLCD